MVVARLILKAVRTLFEQLRAERMTLQGFYPEWAMPTYSLLRFLVIAIAAVMVFPYLPGSGSEGFKGISVFVGLLVSLGAASAIAHVIAGIVITYMRPFAVGGAPPRTVRSTAQQPLRCALARRCRPRSKGQASATGQA